mmetsp:Transcript_50674/g.120992  ORF Transcript_50674/g.120992 Transcript_50674/m.120992 type:complete len:219 (+) Transcript_50674:637-1293(+)
MEGAHWRCWSEIRARSATSASQVVQLPNSGAESCGLFVIHRLIGPPCEEASAILHQERDAQKNNQILETAEADENPKDLLSHANVPGRDLPHREDDVEKPKASEEDPGHHLQSSRATELCSQPAAAQVDHQQSQGGGDIEHRHAEGEVSTLHDEGPLRPLALQIRIARKPGICCPHHRPVDCSDRPREPDAEKHVHGVTASYVHDGCIGILIGHCRDL